MTTGGQAVGAINGAGSTTVNGSLTANSIVQDTLIVGAGGSVTIRQSSVGPVNSTWISNLDGKWLTSGNWSPSAVPNVAGATANFTGNLPTTVTVDGPVTVGTINLTADNSYTISGSNASRIAMQQIGPDGTASICIPKSGVLHTINAPLVVATNTEITGPGSLTAGNIATNTGQLLTIGTSVAVDAFEGTGSTAVEGDLIADSIVQNSLIIGAGIR